MSYLPIVVVCILAALGLLLFGIHVLRGIPAERQRTSDMNRDAVTRYRRRYGYTVPVPIVMPQTKGLWFFGSLMIVSSVAAFAIAALLVSQTLYSSL